MELPEVSLGASRTECPGAAQPIVIVPPDAMPGAAADATTDAASDGTDARVDAPGDAAADAEVTPPRSAGHSPGALAVLPAGTADAAAGALWLALTHWASQCWRGARKTITNPRGPWHSSPESLAAHDAYRRSRAWVPPGQQGRLIGPAGNAYHLTGARFGLVTGYAWAWLWARPLRITIAAAIAGAVFLGFWLG
jgi:hypothetical protein